jgi:pimeloyl-ACP methyl ester carboxylesterase
MLDTTTTPGPAAKGAAEAAGNAGPIRGKTAILVIHGIGEQMPFATLDQFAQGFIQYLTPTQAAGSDTAATWPYRLTQQTTYADNDRGCDFCLRLTHPDSPASHLDLHEYYWAFQTEKQTSLSEISDWLSDALDSFRKHYKEGSKLQQEYEGRNAHRKVSKLAWLRWGVWIWRVGQLGNSLISWLPSGVLRSIRSGAEAIFPAKLVTDYIGDVVVYTTTDRKSRFYGIRDAILKAAQAKLRALLQADYERVIVVGHSLGTVVGYDVLNRLDLISNFPEHEALKTDLSKLKAFFTFGSPLDKVYFFLREQAEHSEYIRRQLLNNLRLFRKRPSLIKETNPVDTDPRFTSVLSELPWLNFYHDNDDISGHLDFYENVQNIAVGRFAHAEDNKWYRAHSGYWTHEPLYHKLLEYALPPDAKAIPSDRKAA